MLNILRQNPRAFVFAVMIHLLLIAALSFNVDWNSKHKLTAPKVEVIQAVMIDESKIKAEEQKRKLEQEQRKKAEQDEKRKQDELKKKQQADKKRQAEQEKKKQEEQKRKAEQEKKKQEEKRRKAEQEKQAEEKRKAEEKKKIEIEEQRKAEEQRKQAELEKKRQQDELKKKQEAERKRLAELEEKRKAEAERLKKLEEQRLADEQRRAEEALILQQQIEAEQAAMNAVRQRALQTELEHFKALIADRIKNKWFRPTNWRAGTSCPVTVRLVPGEGTAQVIDVRLVSSCGNPLFDRSVENAVYSASPLPISTAPELIDQFREMTFNFKPE